MALTSLLAASVALLSAGVAQEPVTLRFNPANGTMKYELSTELKQEMMGMDLGMATKYVMSMEFSKSDEAIKAVTTISNVEVNLPAGSMMEAGRDQMIQALTGMKTIMTFDELGVVKDVKVEGDRQGQMMAGASGMSMLGASFPKDPVAINAEWTQEIDYSKFMMEGAAASKPIPIVHRLVKVENGVASLESRMDGTMTMEMQGQTMKMNMKSLTKSTLEIATGMLIESTAESNSTIEIAGTTIPQLTKVTMRRLP
jgi:hypothetical protein